MGSPAVGTNERLVYMVGAIDHAHSYADQRGIPRRAYRVVNSPRSLAGRRPDDCWVIMLPSFWALPQHFMLVEAVRFLERGGATVEWV